MPLDPELRALTAAPRPNSAARAPDRHDHQLL